MRFLFSRQHSDCLYLCDERLLHPARDHLFYDGPDHVSEEIPCHEYRRVPHPVRSFCLNPYPHVRGFPAQVRCVPTDVHPRSHLSAPVAPPASAKSAPSTSSG